MEGCDRPTAYRKQWGGCRLIIQSFAWPVLNVVMSSDVTLHALPLNLPFRQANIMKGHSGMIHALVMRLYESSVGIGSLANLMCSRWEKLYRTECIAWVTEMDQHRDTCSYDSWGSFCHASKRNSHMNLQGQSLHCPFMQASLAWKACTLPPSHFFGTWHQHN